MTITHQIHDIEEVLKYFSDGFNLKPGQQVAKHLTNYDARTGKVVFFFYCDEVSKPEDNP